jgi:hypothetical protein
LKTEVVTSKPTAADEAAANASALRLAPVHQSRHTFPSTRRRSILTSTIPKMASVTVIQICAGWGSRRKGDEEEK